MAKQEYGRAILLFRNVLEADPNNQEANELIKKAKRAVESDVEVHYKRAYNYYKSKDYKKSKQECEHALELNPEFKPAIDLMKLNNIHLKGKNPIYVVPKIKKDEIKDEALKRYLLERYLSKMNNRSQTKYHIQIIKPNTNIDYKLLLIEPAPGVEYKMGIIDLLTIPKIEITNFRLIIPQKDVDKNRKQKSIMELLYQGIKKYQKEEYAEAIKIWEEVLKIDPGNSKAIKYINRAKFKIDQKNNK